MGIPNSGREDQHGQGFCLEGLYVPQRVFGSCAFLRRGLYHGGQGETCSISTFVLCPGGFPDD